eukprot:s1782_g27.t1
MEALLEELRRSQDRLRKEVLAGQAAILSELRSLHQYWKQQLGPGAAQGLGEDPAEPEVQELAVSKVSGEEAVERRLSEGLQDFTDSIVQSIEGLSSKLVFELPAGPGPQPKTTVASYGTAFERSVRFAPEPPWRQSSLSLSAGDGHGHGDTSAHATPGLKEPLLSSSSSEHPTKDSCDSRDLRPQPQEERGHDCV